MKIMLVTLGATTIPLNLVLYVVVRDWDVHWHGAAQLILIGLGCLALIVGLMLPRKRGSER